MPQLQLPLFSDGIRLITATAPPPITRSQRSREDAAATRGVAATDEERRVMASLPAVSSDFSRPCKSITHGGVLFALPALLATGLLRHAARFFTLPAGFYGLGIDIELCNTRRLSMKWEKAEIHPDVILVSGAYPRLTDLQLLGYAYIKL